jgi:prepilin-type N-terminal cleavage/methylation domain-containing protein
MGDAPCNANSIIGAPGPQLHAVCPVPQNRNPQERGFTLIEILVALVILILGTGLVWYTFKSSARLDAANRNQQDAIALAQAELERLRIIPHELIRDTAYTAAGSQGNRYTVVRTVFDSTKIEEAYETEDITEENRSLFFQRPLEVRVTVDEEKQDASAYDNRDRPIIALYLFLPEYQWH